MKLIMSLVDDGSYPAEDLGVLFSQEVFHFRMLEKGISLRVEEFLALGN